MILLARMKSARISFANEGANEGSGSEPRPLSFAARARSACARALSDGNELIATDLREHFVLPDARPRPKPSLQSLTTPADEHLRGKRRCDVWKDDHVKVNDVVVVVVVLDVVVIVDGDGDLNGHTTVMSAVRKIEGRILSRDAEVLASVQAIEHRLNRA